MSVIDEYLERVDPLQKAGLGRLRTIVKNIVPEAEEVMSYGMPAFKYKNRILIYFAAFKDHMSLFPASDQAIESIGEDLGKFRTSKGTFQFTTDKPIPEPLLKAFITFRMESIAKTKA